MIVDWVEFAATLPEDFDFDCFWESVLQRMAGNTHAPDFREPAMAQYLRKHILDDSGAFLRAPWRCGLGSVLLGFTTYATNAVEVSHRVVSGLLRSFGELKPPYFREAALVGNVGRFFLICVCRFGKLQGEAVHGFVSQDRRFG